MTKRIVNISPLNNQNFDPVANLQHHRYLQRTIYSPQASVHSFPPKKSITALSLREEKDKGGGVSDF